MRIRFSEDGAAELRRYLIEGELCDGTSLPHSVVPSREFVNAAWVDPHWGAKAIVRTWRAAMLCEAIKTLSGDIPTRRIFGHIAWRRLDEQWVSLPADGATGEGGEVQYVAVASPASWPGTGCQHRATPALPCAPPSSCSS